MHSLEPSPVPLFDAILGCSETEIWRNLTDYLMHKYHCPRCKVDFFKKEKNINQRHNCGELSKLDWSFRGEFDEEDRYLLE